jgi:hypothetical protein
VIPKKSKWEVAREFAATQKESVREFAASVNRKSFFSFMDRRGSKSYESTNQTPSDSDGASSSSSSSSDSSLSSSDLDTSSSEDEDAAAPLPQSRNPRNVPVRNDLARSLVGNLVMTPSTRNLTMTDDLDDCENADDDPERKERIQNHQRQFTIAKKQHKVSIQSGLVLLISSLDSTISFAARST